jgi:hypothetical protein
VLLRLALEQVLALALVQEQEQEQVLEQQHLQVLLLSVQLLDSSS